MMKQSVTKIISLLLIIGLNWAGLSAIGQTVAYFNDTETSIENTFSAGTLDISADGLGDFSLNLNPNNQAVRNVMVGNDESLGVKYLVEASDIEGDICDYLKVKAMLVGDVKYEGSLVDLLSEIIEIDSSAPNKNWNFKISFSGDEDKALDLDGEACQFNFHFKSWQTNIDEYNEGSGFTDQEKVFTRVNLRVPHTLAQDYVVLNEFLPNPLGNETSLKGIKGEWVELYNNHPDQSFDLSGWYIKDEADNQIFIADDNTYNNSSVIGAKGSDNEWLVVFMDGAVLNNDGDKVELFDNNGNSIDSYNYSDPVPENKSYARYPDGVGGWVDPIPTPGGPNKLEEVIQESTSQGEVSIEVNTEEIPEEVGSTEEIIVEIIPEVVPEEPPVIEEQPAIEEPPVVVEEIVSEPVPPPADPPAPAPAE